MLIDDFQRSDLISTLGARWRGISDQVMGGISQHTLEYANIGGCRGLRLAGDVCLENNGGFIQMALDLDVADRPLDVSAFVGIKLMVYGNDEQYSVHLRTTDIDRPWQSYRAHFIATRQWQEIRLPFSDFQPHRVDAPLDLRRLRRLGLVAIGRVFRAELVVGKVCLF